MPNQLRRTWRNCLKSPGPCSSAPRNAVKRRKWSCGTNLNSPLTSDIPRWLYYGFPPSKGNPNNIPRFLFGAFLPPCFLNGLLQRPMGFSPDLLLQSSSNRFYASHVPVRASRKCLAACSTASFSVGAPSIEIFQANCTDSLNGFRASHDTFYVLRILFRDTYSRDMCDKGRSLTCPHCGANRRALSE
jgi:hypothetical protein